MRKNAAGEMYYATMCSECVRSPEGIARQKERKKGYLPPAMRLKAEIKKSYCEKCGFVAEHPCQLDIDHVDGNNKNNDLSNLMTLCANCHRLKTNQSGENHPWRYLTDTQP